MQMTKHELLNYLNEIKLKEAERRNAAKVVAVPQPPTTVFDTPDFTGELNEDLIEDAIDYVENSKPVKKNMPTPTEAQAKVIEDIKTWYGASHGFSIYQLAGYAGVGKSTVVDIILNELGVNPSLVRLCAPTGTASLVLKEKTPGYTCTTLHKLFYEPKTLSTGKTIFIPSVDSLMGLKLIIIDEASMVGERTANEILPLAEKAGVKVIVVGDPGQLPPVKDNEYFFKNPNSILTEVLRQAADNPIIKLSMDIREATEKGLAYSFSNTDQNIGGKVFIYDRTKISVSQYAKLIENGGVVIAGMNKTRKTLNQAIRTHLGFSEPTLMNGEQIVIKENLGSSEDGIAVTNGMRGTVSLVTQLEDGYIKFRFTPEAFEGHRTIKTHVDVLFEKEPASKFKDATEIVFGYVITGHASQGSQWKTVYVIDESSVFNRRENPEGYKSQNHWLYTAVTRAAENLVILRQPKRSYQVA